jgi:hypothetical protein
VVAQGFTHIEGIDYDETLRPRRKVRLAPHNTRGIAAERNLEVHQGGRAWYDEIKDTLT